jgi:ornithine cyclodeaminase/alanine dehydrogenase-like protein (mu-crystallin family)
VIAIGACRVSQREISPALVQRAALFVDSRAAALAESGDIVQGIHEGRFGPEHIRAELGDVAAGRAPGRTSPAEVTLFKSLGQAIEDLVAADLAYRRALAIGRGIRLTLT